MITEAMMEDEEAAHTDTLRLWKAAQALLNLNEGVNR